MYSPSLLYLLSEKKRSLALYSISLRRDRLTEVIPGGSLTKLKKRRKGLNAAVEELIRYARLVGGRACCDDEMKS